MIEGTLNLVVTRSSTQTLIELHTAMFINWLSARGKLITALNQFFSEKLHKKTIFVQIRTPNKLDRKHYLTI